MKKPGPRLVSPYEAEAQQLKRWLAELRADVESVFESKRLRFGNMAGDALLKLRRQSLTPMPQIARVREMFRRLESWQQDLPAFGQSPAVATTVSYPDFSPTVVIPIYNGYDAVLRCIDSVVKNTDSRHQLLLLNDCSSDERIKPLLDSYAEFYGHVRVIHHGANRGYTANVNVGCRLAPGDVVLLNSDTAVTPGWLRKLQLAAYSQSNVATVTPLSNNASAFSVPKNNEDNQLPVGLSVDDVGYLVESLSERVYPQAPTGNGFCMYITRRALAAVGLFDETSYPRGYGEENDFAMRALDLGFVHLIDDATFVYHQGSVSLGPEKEQVMARSRQTLLKRHPDYERLVGDWLQHDELSELRVALQEIWRRPPTIKDRLTLLYVVHDGGGGTAMANDQLAQAMAQKHDVYVLQMALSSWRLSRVQNEKFSEVERMDFAAPWSATEPLSFKQRQQLQKWTQRYHFDLAHVQHILGAGPELIGALKELELPVLLMLHDFTFLCPTLHLINNQRKFCAGVCDSLPGDCAVPSNWFSNLPPLKDRFVRLWRERCAEGLAAADVVVTPNFYTRELVQRHFPFSETQSFYWLEHGADLSHFTPASAAAKAGEKVRLVLFGAFGSDGKGIPLIEALLQKNQAKGAPFEFHVLGDKRADFKPEQWGAIYHGGYDAHELPRKLAAINAAFALIPSAGAETFCYTLSEAWAAQLPVVASNLGALRERIERHGGGWLLPPDDADIWFNRLRELAADAKEYERVFGQVRVYQHKSVEQMCEDYAALYRRMLRFECGKAQL